MIEIKNVEDVNLTDNMIEVNSYRFEILVRDSERLSVLMNFIAGKTYVDVKDLNTILGMQKGGDDTCQQ